MAELNAPGSSVSMAATGGIPAQQTIQVAPIGGGLPETPGWSAGRQCVAGQLLYGSNGTLVQCTVGGTAGGVQPAWPATVGATVTDGQCTWQVLVPGLGAFVGVGQAASGATLPASVTPNEFWVSNGNKAADANSGDRYSPFATLAHAVSVAEALNAPYKIHLGYGDFTISAADAHGNGLTITQPGATLEGLGEDLTTINITASGLVWGIKFTYTGADGIANQKAKGFTLNATGAITLPYWVIGVTVGSNGHSENGVFEHILLNYGGGGAVVPTIPGSYNAPNYPAAFAMGPDNPGGNQDIADWNFYNCWVLGPGAATQAIGFLVGNQADENITANSFYECGVARSMDYGLVLSGGGCHWYGGFFSAISVCDIVVNSMPGETINFYGLRCESGNTFLICNATGTGEPIINIYGALVNPYNPVAVAAGVIIQFASAGKLNLDGCWFNTSLHNTSIEVTNGGRLTSKDCTYDVLNPFPAASSTCTRIIIGTDYWPAAGAASANPSFQFVVDGQAGAGLGSMSESKANVGPPSVTTSTYTPGANGQCFYVPFFNGGLLFPVTQLKANVTTAGAAGALVRLGIYADTGNFTPGALVVDGGTVAATSTGVATATVAATNLAPNTLYWLACAVQGAPATLPTLTAVVPISSVYSSTFTVEGAQYANGVTGAFLATAAATNPTLEAPLVLLHT